MLVDGVVVVVEAMDAVGTVRQPYDDEPQSSGQTRAPQLISCLTLCCEKVNEMDQEMMRWITFTLVDQACGYVVERL